MFRKLTSQKKKLRVRVIIGRLQCYCLEPPNTYQAIIKRGSKTLQSLPFRPVKQRVYRLDQDTFNFESTFNYDQESKSYLEKTLIITIKQTDKKVKEEVCRIQIDMSDYLNSQDSYFALEYDFEYRGQQSKLYFDLDFNQQQQVKMDKKVSLPQTAANTENSSPEKMDFYESYAVHQEEWERESKMLKLQKQNQLLRLEIQRLLTVQSSKNLVDGLNDRKDEERRQLKQKLDQKDTQLGIVLDKNRQLQQKFDKAQRQIRQQSKTIQQLTQQLQKSKMQECLQIGDPDMIALAEKHCG